jgi:hypothetical protein
VGFDRGPRALRFARGIDAEDLAGDLGIRDALCLGMQQAEINREVPIVVIGEALVDGGFVQ